MTWREAFLVQARSDFVVFTWLGSLRGAEMCHRLHYFQMVTEKLAKGWLATRDQDLPPATVHSALVRMLQVIKSRPDVRQRLGYASAAVFARYVDSLLHLAHRIERFAPARLAEPNPEYPWREAGTGTIHAPAEFYFADFDPAVRPQWSKLERLVRELLKITES